MPEMHQNTFEEEELMRSPSPRSRSGGPTSKGRKGRGRYLLVKGTKGREGRGEGRKGRRREFPQSQDE